MAELSLVEEIQLLINLGVDPTVAATTVNNERTRRAPPAPAPAGLSQDDLSLIVAAVRDGVTAGLLATRRSRAPTTLPDTPEEELPAEEGLLHDHMHVAATQAIPYTLNVGTRHATDTNFYLGRLLHNFYNVNGTDRFEWIKTKRHILLKDGKRFVRKTGVTVFDARNLLLELGSTNYRYDQWVAKRNNGEFENYGYSSFETPPDN
mmetsp:Transcript_4967/g.7370  ORF Transcript_4967/g.7370 Transcript_4967/m.7370 type:complete len:206 (-) Transcript_4967:512-1129(-)